MTFSNASRFSAFSIAAKSVPMIFTPRFISGSARLIAVCPPSDAITPSGFSSSITFITSSGVSGSKYSLSLVV
ncbi:MAG: hypothetical protein BWY81_00049 [Firmicutes bacterium ADurb.Bin467]|nr:MAG: hypothetical protein BWY81_00049 [Firmicutes bacterium ADurb.Bin467]